MEYSHTIKICLVLIYLVTLTTANQCLDLGLGDDCQLKGTGNPGKCKFLQNCEEAQNDLRFNAKLPTCCGYQGLKQIVCCARREQPTPLTNPRMDINSNLPIVVQKCLEYSRYVFTNISLLTYETNGNAISKSTDRCGHISVPLIIGGTPASSREFPHSALLGYRQANGQIAWDCGGSLISRRYVLTAAHCLKSPLYDVDVSQVRLGELVLNDDTDEATVTDIPVQRIIPNPDYRKSTRYNDIALLRLIRKVDLTPFIRPICLPTSDVDPAKSIATGWGATEVGGANSNALLKVVLESYSNVECNDIFQYNLDRKLRKGIIATQLCAGSRTEAKDTCQGDSGGPLQIFHVSTYCMYTQIGVTSFGVGCGTVNFPGVYTRVYNYVPWIESVIWAPGEDD